VYDRAVLSRSHYLSLFLARSLLLAATMLVRFFPSLSLFRVSVSFGAARREERRTRGSRFSLEVASLVQSQWKILMILSNVVNSTGKTFFFICISALE
jgi:hypothetical protein